MSRLALLSCLVATLSCGGSGGLSPDATPPSDAGAEVAPPVPTSCVLATQSPCGAAEQCNPFCQDQKLVVACRAEPAMPAALGEPCTGAVQCGRGSTCLAISSMPAQCLKHCTATPDCPAGKGCRDVKVTYNCNPAGPEMLTLRACL